MNLPNKITVFRVILIPFFIFFMLCPSIPYGNIIALVIFSVACTSDFIDGFIARKYNLITDFGKMMDPLADKVLVCSALICFVELPLGVPSWLVIVIIAREFTISALRMLAVDNGVVIAASKIAKVKTVVQMFMCLFYIADFSPYWWKVGQVILMYSALVLTILSLIEYIYKNRKLFLTNLK